MFLKIPFTGPSNLQEMVEGACGRELRATFEQFFKELVDFIRWKFGNPPFAYPGDCEDVTMEAFTHFYYYSLKYYDSTKGSFEKFFIACVMNFVRSKYRGYKNQQVHVSLDNPELTKNPPEVLKDSRTCEDIIDNISFKRDLIQFKSKDPEAADVLQLLDKGYRKKQVLDILGISPSTFKRRQKRGRNFLKSRVVQKY
jgi:DNA-directed RNA polymerase specialized sigma24 family protein